MNDRGEVAYEMEKKRGRYTNICVQHDSDSEDYDGIDQLAIELAQKATIAAHRELNHASIHEDSTEVVTINPGHNIEPFEQKRILEPISDCVTGDVKTVQKYLETSSEAQLFVKGRFPDGQTTLIKAAAEQSSAMVSLLIKHGAEVNAVGASGRTSLMEAALFGRINNVKVLLDHGAHNDIRDDEKRSAIDFARDLPKNRLEVYDRTAIPSSYQRLGYIEDTFERDIDRKGILHLLGEEGQKSKIVFGRPPTLATSRSYSFKTTTTQDSFVLCGPIEKYPITRGGKTVARLERGGKFSSVGAMSGWSHSSVQFLRVNGRQWTDDVFYISEVVGHVLSPHSGDWGKDGQYNACHAEKQLIAYFIDRHVFLPRDRLPDLELEDEIKLRENELQTVFSSTGIGCQVTALRARREDLEYQLFDGDEKLVGKHEEIRKLKSSLRSVESTLNRLISSPGARPFLELESRLEVLHQRLQRHTDLTYMANAPPPESLTEGVILISSRPCPDCIMFKNKVNEFFGLSIKLYATL
ncbi:Ankyrin repeat protein [Penicillium frequentans]|uniref:Ankyrin repeat protein n=1 Tax=Penicillium frequentans TaxID=3151616 RepID=A0AAD6CXZ7_9EURO|nr:Ankyrin repeat protein [Penicillium glabrum]